MKQLTMLVVTHKQVAIPTIKDYQPIVVGNGRVSKRRRVYWTIPLSKIFYNVMGEMYGESYTFK